METKDFGKYELRERLGKGAMGWVFAGIQKQLELPVAVKIPFPQFSEEEEFRQRFQQEARAMARMNHENVVRVIDFGDHEGTPFIVMEFLPGSDLRTQLDRDGFPPIEIALLMILDICRGLEHAHGKGIVHRDLKPSNVMFTREGVCKLMDFGLARRRDDTLHLTRTGVVMGTTPYMSPEQTRGTELDHRSDIFSLGVICYELLGGERPFQGESSTAIMTAILHHAPRPLEALDPLVPEEILWVIGRMLEKERDARPASVTDVRRVVESAVGDLRVNARDLLERYAAQSTPVSEELRGTRLAQCLERGRASAASGPDGIDAALSHFRSALYLDPKNKEASGAIKQLEHESKRRKAAAERAAAEAATPAPPPRQAPKPKVEAPAPTPEPSPDITVIQTPAMVAALAASATPAKASAKAAAPSKPAKPAKAERPASKPPAKSPAGATLGTERSRIPLILGAAATVLVLAVVGVIAIQRGRAPAPNDPSAGPSGSAAAGTMPLPPASPVADSSTSSIAPMPAATEVPSLVVRTRPVGATVTISGLASHPGPARFEKLPAGMVAVRVAKPGYATLDTVLTLAGGRDTTVRFALTALDSTSLARAMNGPAPPPPPQPGTPRSATEGASFTFRAWPWADVYVDGQLVLAHADTAKVPVAPGKRWVEFRNPDYETIRQLVKFENGGSERLYAAYYLQKGYIAVATADNRPCTVFIDGDADPTAAPHLYEVKAGRHRVDARRNGVPAAEGEKRIRLRKGDRVEIVFSFPGASTAR